MARLPTVAGDNNAWGTILNAFLSVAHNSDGTLKNLGFVTGADPTGATDSTSAIQSYITAMQSAGGGDVILPFGTYSISNNLIINHDLVRFRGMGRGTVLQTLAGFPASTPMVWVQGPGGAGNFRFGSGVFDMRLVNTAGPTSAIGIQFDSTYYARIHRVDVEGVYGNNIFLNGIGGAFGAYTSIRDCHIGNVPSGSGSGGIGLLTSNHEFNVIDSCVFNWFNQAGGYGIKLQNGSNAIKNSTFDECDTGIWNWFQSHNKIESCQFDRGLTQFVYLNGCKDTTIANNGFQGFVGSGSKNMINVDGGSSNASNEIIGNTCKSGTTWTNFISETGGTYTQPNTYTANDTAGLAITRLASTAGGGLFSRNRGYNPTGPQTAPGIPASATALLNPFGVDAMVLVTGGTVSNVAIGGTNTGQTSGWFRIPANQTITLTYTVAPTWAWWGE